MLEQQHAGTTRLISQEPLFRIWKLSAFRSTSGNLICAHLKRGKRKLQQAAVLAQLCHMSLESVLIEHEFCLQPSVPQRTVQRPITATHRTNRSTLLCDFM